MSPSVLEQLPPLPPEPAASPPLTRSSQAVHHSSFVTHHSPPSPQSIFRQEGDYWTVAFAGEVCRIKNLQGMQYIAQLLRQPYEEIHVLTLATGELPPAEGPTQDSSQSYAEGMAGSPFQDAGEMLDPQARAAYKHRLSELQTEREEAQEFNDLGRVERLQEEMDFLTQELSQAVGLGGRARKVGSTAERARVNVTKRIRAAIKRIAASHPALGDHLKRTIQTGTFCTYAPESAEAFDWQS